MHTVLQQSAKHFNIYDTQTDSQRSRKIKKSPKLNEKQSQSFRETRIKRAKKYTHTFAALEKKMQPVTKNMSSRDISSVGQGNEKNADRIARSLSYKRNKNTLRDCLPMDTLVQLFFQSVLNYTPIHKRHHFLRQFQRGLMFEGPIVCKTPNKQWASKVLLIP